MKRNLLYTLLMICYQVSGQAKTELLNTAKNCSYMSALEREMIFEINRVRNDPSSYLQYIKPMLNEAQKKLEEYGKGEPNYSLTTTTLNDRHKQVDTTWHFINEENVHALSTLVDDLKRIRHLSVLKPDAGIYKAASRHAADQHEHNWTLGHTGTDGSLPWERILKYSPNMKFGNENIAGNSGHVTPRDIVIQLLVDAGIPGYGHRYNLLDPQWTHVACKGERVKDEKNWWNMNWWIQNFGVIRLKKNK